MRMAWWQGVLAGAGLVGLAAAAALSAPAAGVAGPRRAPAAATGACGKAQGPFHVKGTQVIGKGGKAFIPYGITVAGLFYPPGYSASTRKADLAKIAATATLWCANTVRLQISQAALVGPKPITGFMQDIEKEVSTAESYHLVVVLNDQTELDPGDPPLPTNATLTFWQRLADRYRKDPQVIFDVYNEPRIKVRGVCGSSAAWRAWQQGTGSFLGMQRLVTRVTQDEKPNYENLLWVEGPCYANSLSLVRSFPVTSKKPLMVYDFHHPAPNGGPTHNPAQWYADFGFLVKNHIHAVVAGEWTNYAPPKGVKRTECWADAPTAAPRFLSYLRGLRIGMTAFDLGKGLLIESNNLGDPTVFRSDWNCQAKKSLDEGAGSLIMNWYKKQNAA